MKYLPPEYSNINTETEDDDIIVQNHSVSKLICINIINMLFVILIVVLLSIWIGFYVYNNQLFCEPTMELLDPSQIGIGVSILQGSIKTNYRSLTLYGFEYGYSKWDLYNRTHESGMRSFTDNVNAYVDGLKPNTKYSYLLIVKINNKQYTTDIKSFATVNIPNLNITSVITTIHNDTNGNARILCNGTVYNINSSYLKCFFQIRVSFGSKYYNLPSINIPPRTSIFSFSQSVGVSSDTTYNIRIGLQEYDSKHIYHSPSILYTVE